MTDIFNRDYVHIQNRSLGSHCFTFFSSHCSNSDASHHLEHFVPQLCRHSFRDLRYLVFGWKWAVFPCLCPVDLFSICILVCAPGLASAKRKISQCDFLSLSNYCVKWERVVSTSITCNTNHYNVGEILQQQNVQVTLTDLCFMLSIPVEMGKKISECKDTNQILNDQRFYVLKTFWDVWKWNTVCVFCDPCLWVTA